MFKKNQNFIFAFDIYGMSTQINTFNGNNKTKVGLIISFIFIALSILYALYTLIDYFKYSTPSIIYFKENEHKTNRTIDMKDSFMFELDNVYTPVNESDIDISANYYKISKNDLEIYSINFEKCEYGKNIDTKHKDKLSDYEIDEYYCLSNDITNYPIYYNSEDDFSQLSIYIGIKEESNFTQELLKLKIINSNNIVNHMKSNPLSDIYFSSSILDITSYKYNLIKCYYQYIKYESDKGFFFEKTNTYNGKVLSNIDYKLNSNDDTPGFNGVINIDIEANNVDFDYYSRSYERFQLVIIEIYWIVDIILLIGRIISNFFIKKKTSIEIVKYLLAKNVTEKSISEEVSININNNKQQKESFFKEIKNINNNNNQQNENIFKEKININNNKIYYLDNNIKQSNNKSKNLDNNNQIDETINNLNINSTNYSFENKSNIDDKRIDVLNSLNYYQIIKSYFCLRDDKAKLINCCEALISDELSIEKILRRINDMEEQINLISNSLSPNNTPKNAKFDEINELIDIIDKKNNQ